MQHIGSSAALITINMQSGLDDPVWGKRNNSRAESNIVRLLDDFNDEFAMIVNADDISQQMQVAH